MNSTQDRHDTESLEHEDTERSQAALDSAEGALLAALDAIRAVKQRYTSADGRNHTQSELTSPTDQQD